MTQRISDYELGYYQDARYYYARLIGDLVDDLVDSREAHAKDRAEVSRLLGEVERLRGLIENSKEGVK